MPVGVDGECLSSVPGELWDRITEALILAGDASRRAAVVRALVAEIYEAGSWLINDSESAELRSLQLVVAETEAHYIRMNTEVDPHRDEGTK